MKLSSVTAITIAMLRFDPELASKLARRRGGVGIWANGRIVFRMVIPSTPLPDDDPASGTCRRCYGGCYR